jgi:dephospho-CoA kinase
MTLIAGLTGGIASGKSTVAGCLREAGAKIIDADRIARQVVSPGQPAYAEICAQFGNGILAPDGGIDRAALGRIVFENTALRRRLEAIVHPRVGIEIDAQIQQITLAEPDAVIIMDIPLLFETGRTHGLAQIIVVYVPASVQLDRLMMRDGLDRRDAMARIASQMPIDEKATKADIVIDNSGTLAQTRAQTLKAYQQLAVQARAQPPPPA